MHQIGLEGSNRVFFSMELVHTIFCATFIFKRVGLADLASLNGLREAQKVYLTH